ncbi:hypothetical protein ABET51_17130 [Metabacillus fastidiosus]|uniref:hypothetical protein n=1 Tax=Metabacillus fastidiosus TaxID=1458 RepID=UPI003D27D22C
MSTSNTKDIIRKKVKETYFSNIEKRIFKINYLFMNNKDKVDKEDRNAIKNSILIKILEALNKKESELPNWTSENNEVFILNIQDYKVKVLISEGINQEKENFWELLIEGDFFLLEELRTLMLVEMSTLFNQKYCLRDDISREINKIAYPLVNELENLLREYLLRFFVKKVGSQWWKFNSNDALNKKSKNHGDNRAFSRLLDMEIYNIDFVDLKELVTGNFRKINNIDIIQALDIIIERKEDPIKVEQKVMKLKESFLGNWEKFFKDHIGISNFEVLWKDLYDIRCMVAHNSLITLKNFYDLVEKYEIIIPNLNEIIKYMGSAVLSNLERESIQNVNAQLEKILSLSITLKEFDIKSLLEGAYLFLTYENLTLGEEEKLLDESYVKSELSFIGNISQYIVQGQEEGEIFSVWIKFEELDEFTIKVLKYGIDINAFK